MPRPRLHPDGCDRCGAAEPVLPHAPAMQLLFTPVVEMSPGGSYVVAVDTAAV